jgi:hypothetical protein
MAEWNGTERRRWKPWFGTEAGNELSLHWYFMLMWCSLLLCICLWLLMSILNQLCMFCFPWTYPLVHILPFNALPLKAHHILCSLVQIEYGANISSAMLQLPASKICYAANCHLSSCTFHAQEQKCGYFLSRLLPMADEKNILLQCITTQLDKKSYNFLTCEDLN